MFHTRPIKSTLRTEIFAHYGTSFPPYISKAYAALPVHVTRDESANAPPPSPGPVTIDGPTTPLVSADTTIVDGVTDSSTLSAPTPNDTRSTPAKPSTPTPNANIYLLERKHRLTSLTPLVFSSAFDDGDPDSLRVLRMCARTLAKHINNLMVAADGSSASGPRAVRPEETVLCFGGSLVGIQKYRGLVVDELGRLRKGLGVGSGEAEDKEEGGGVVAGVVFVDDAAINGAMEIASRFTM